MNYYRLASLFNHSDWQVLAIWRKGEDEYWVTDYLATVRLNHEEYCKFKSIYCSRKNNPYIPDIEIGGKLRTMDHSLIMNEAPDMQLISDDAEKAEDITITNLMIIDPDYDEQLIVYTGKDFAGAMSLDYYNLFGRDFEYKTRDFNNPIFVLKDNEVVGVIMPLWNNGSIENEIEKVSDKI
jgi:hypothetical protein